MTNDRPEEGKQYRLTGGYGVKSIANGNSWKESLVNEAKHKALEKKKGKKPSLDEMHKTSSSRFRKLSKASQEDFAKRDRDQSRLEMIQKLEVAGDYESANLLKGNN